jgi:hypothetical protein
MELMRPPLCSWSEEARMQRRIVTPRVLGPGATFDDAVALVAKLRAEGCTDEFAPSLWDVMRLPRQGKQSLSKASLLRATGMGEIFVGE